MKKILAIILTLCLAIGLAAPAFAADSISYYLRGGTAEYEPYLYEGLVGLQVLQNMSDVDIDWTVVCGSGDEIQAQYLAMLASGNYPDVIQWLHNEQYSGGVSQLYNDGIIIELNDVIDQYMPKYKAFLESHPDIAASLMNDEGKYLYFTVINPLETADDKAAVTWWGLEMRQDWLDNLNLDVPTTIDEWYEVLTAFNTMDPNGNGNPDDEIPFDGGSAGLQLFLPAFDIMSGVYVNPETGKIGYGEYTQNYKEYLETMAKWYAEGLIDNVYNEDGSITDTADDNIYADLAGSWKGLSNYWEQRLPQLLEKNPNADFVAVQWPKDANGNIYGGYYTYSYIDRTTTVITVDCKNVEAVARLMDNMLSEEGCTLLTWGTEEGDDLGGLMPEFAVDENGVLHGEYYVAEDGSKQLTDWALETVKFYDGEFRRQYLYSMSHISFPRIGGMDFTLATREGHYVDSSRMWAESDPSLAYPAAIVLSTDAQKAAASAVDDINSYISEMTWKFITGQEPLTSFDTYMDTLQKMGIEDLIAAYQEAYDNFLARGK